MWLDDMLCSRLLREHQGDYLALAKQVRAAGAPAPHYFYVSVYRPLTWVGWDAGLPQPIYTQVTSGGNRSIVGTRAPLPLDRIQRLDLYPFDARTKAQLAIDFAASQGAFVELSTPDDASTILLFRNPRGKWQLSYFQMDVGPTGHLEHESDPVEILREAVGTHCRWTPGRVDAIVGSLAGYWRR